jgi:hypothetical protein
MASSVLTPPLGASNPVPAGKRIVMALAGVMALLPVAISIHEGGSDWFASNSFTPFGMWGTFAIHVSTRPSRKELGITVAIGLLLRVLYNLAVGERSFPGSLIINMGTYLGLASLAVLAVRSLESSGERRATCRRSLGAVALLSYIGICLGFYINFARVALPRKLDYFLYNFDGSLGFQPSFAAARLAQMLPAVYRIEALVYDSLGFWFALLFAVHINSRLKYRLNVLKLLIVNAVLGFSLYFLFPAMGPKYAFPSFPVEPGAVTSAAVFLQGVPNAMPSLHMGGILLIFWISRPWKWLRVVTGSLAVLTFLATLGLGEHYLIDLVVAVPYALAILALSSSVPERKLPLAVGTAMLLAWLVILRAGHFYPVVSWTLVLTTVGMGLVMERRLASRLWVAEPLTHARPEPPSHVPA